METASPEIVPQNVKIENQLQRFRGFLAFWFAQLFRVVSGPRKIRKELRPFRGTNRPPRENRLRQKRRYNFPDAHTAQHQAA